MRQLRATVAGELLGDTDRRLPLPGGLGLAEELSPPLPPPPPQPPAGRRRPGTDTAAQLLHDRHMAVSGAALYRAGLGLRTRPAHGGQWGGSVAGWAGTEDTTGTWRSVGRLCTGLGWAGTEGP